MQSKLLNKFVLWVSSFKMKKLRKRYHMAKENYWFEKAKAKAIRAEKKANKEAAKHERKEKKDLPKLTDMNRGGRRKYMVLWRRSQIIHRWKPKQKYKRVPPLHMSARAKELERLMKIENKQRGIK